MLPQEVAASLLPDQMGDWKHYTGGGTRLKTEKERLQSTRRTMVKDRKKDKSLNIFNYLLENKKELKSRRMAEKEKYCLGPKTGQG